MELESAKNTERPGLISEGVKIARARRAELSEAATKSPERVLSAMMDLSQLAALPPEIRAESEIPFSGVGSIDLQWETSIRPDGTLNCTHYNQAVVGDKTWRVAGAEFKDAHRPVVDIPLNGYVVGDILVLEKSSVKTLTASELAVSGEFFEEAANQEMDPVTGGNADPSVAALIAGKVYRFENAAIIEHVEDTLAKAEAKAASGGDDRTVNHGFQWLPVQATGGSGANGSIVQATPFQADNIRVLFIRAEFSDTTTPTASFNELSGSLLETNTRIQDFSYGKASLITREIAPVGNAAPYILPTPGATVAKDGDNAKIIAEARAAAQADGFVLENYDVVGVFFPSLSDLPDSQIKYGGFASIGGGNHWINGVSQPNQVPILLHEFGHNYGLFHANYFNPERDFTSADNGVHQVEYLDPNQSSLEYGDIYDRMGEGNKDDGYFSPYAMSRLEWMPASKVVQPTGSGTFTVHRFDHPDAKDNTTLALRIPMGGDRYDWVGLRQRYQETAGNAYIVGEGIYTDRPNLIDATPGSNSDKFLDRADSTLPSTPNANSYRNAGAGVTITNEGSGGTPDDEFITVRVDFDPRLELQKTNVLIDESAGNAALVVERSFNTVGQCSVAYSTTAGTATSGSDFHPTSGTLTWNDGDNSPKTILIPIRPDSNQEGSETFTMTLSSPVNAVIPPNTSVATVTILDPGRLLPDFAPPSFDFQVETLLSLDDGRVVVGGDISNRITGNITRFNSDGSEDESFVKGTGFGGTSDSNFNTTVLSIARQTDGSLIVGGNFTDYNGVAAANITRLDADGTVDAAFAAAVGTGANNGFVRTVAIEASGKLLVGGDFTGFNGTAVNGLIRLNADGTPDTVSPLNIPFAFTDIVQPSIHRLLVQDDGKLMIAGQFALTPMVSGEFRASIARLGADGMPDSSFDPGYGAHSSGANNSPGFVTSIARQADGKYLIGGLFTGYDDTSVTSLVRIEETGALDSSFTAPAITLKTGSNGFPVSPGVGDIRILQTGLILAAGNFVEPAGFILALQSSGATDPTFDLATGADFRISSLDTNDAGEIFIGGGFLNFAGERRARIVKVAGGLQPYIRWRDSNFTIAQISSGNTGAEEDFDDDGILNVTEMALGLSPTVNNSPNSFAIAAENLSVQTSGDSKFLQATMQRSADNLGVWLVAQFSSDLTTWLPADPVPGSNSTYEITESTSTRFTVRDKTPSGPGVKRFVRFRAVVPN